MDRPRRFELPVMALLCLDAGDIEHAIELNAASLQSRYIANSVWFEAIVRQHISRAAADLPPDVAAAAESQAIVAMSQHNQIKVATNFTKSIHWLASLVADRY